MRIISQDSIIDMPYDTTTLYIDNMVGSSIIFARGNGNTMCLAKYNNEDEAKAILKRIRESYINNKAYFQFPPKGIKEREDKLNAK